MDTVTDSDWFYNSILELFDDIEEQEEVHKLIEWNRYVHWGSVDIRNLNLMRYRQIFPNYISTRWSFPINSILVKIKEHKAAFQATQNKNFLAHHQQCSVELTDDNIYIVNHRFLCI